MGFTLIHSHTEDILQHATGANNRFILTMTTLNVCNYMNALDEHFTWQTVSRYTQFYMKLLMVVILDMTS